MCDVESYCYLPLLEELNYIPQHKYSFAPEILEHSRRIARHYRLYDNALLQTAITGMQWNEAEQRWIITTHRGDRFKARYVAMANGPLSKPKLPGIPGINEFRGHTFHTSRWDYQYTGGDSFGNLTNLKDKRIGIIGTGATAVRLCWGSAQTLHRQFQVLQGMHPWLLQQRGRDREQARLLLRNLRRRVAALLRGAGGVAKRRELAVRQFWQHRQGHQTPRHHVARKLLPHTCPRP